MTPMDRVKATDRLRRALLTFQSTQTLLLRAHRKAKVLTSAAEVENFWMTNGGQVETSQRAAAMEVQAAFTAFSAAGLIADAGDRHLVTEARRFLADG